MVFSKIDRPVEEKELKTPTFKNDSLANKIMEELSGSNEKIFNPKNKSFVGSGRVKKEFKSSFRSPVNPKRHFKISNFSSFVNPQKQSVNTYSKPTHKMKGQNYSFANGKLKNLPLRRTKPYQRNKSPINNFKSKIKEIRAKFNKQKPNSSFIQKKTKCIDIDKNTNIYSKLDPEPLFRTEAIIYQVFDAIINKKDIYDLFKIYMDYIQDYDYDGYFKLLSNKETALLYKNGFILERISLMICFYLLINDMYDSEIVFLQKLVFLIYSNFYSFILLIVKDPNGIEWLEVY